MNPWVIGVDLGGTKIRLGLVNPDDTIVATRQIATNPHEGIDAVTARIGAAVDELQESVPSGCRVAALGICSPGPVDHEAGMLIDPPTSKACTTHRCARSSWSGLACRLYSSTTQRQRGWATITLAPGAVRAA